MFLQSFCRRRCTTSSAGLRPFTDSTCSRSRCDGGCRAFGCEPHGNPSRPRGRCLARTPSARRAPQRGRRGPIHRTGVSAAPHPWTSSRRRSAHCASSPTGPGYSNIAMVVRHPSRVSERGDRAAADPNCVRTSRSSPTGRVWRGDPSRRRLWTFDRWRGTTGRVGDHRSRPRFPDPRALAVPRPTTARPFPRGGGDPNQPRVRVRSDLPLLVAS